MLKAKGIELVVDEVWTPPLAGATSIVGSPWSALRRKSDELVGQVK